MKTKLKQLKKTVVYLVMALVLTSAMIFCFLLSFFDEEAYESAWKTFFENDK